MDARRRQLKGDRLVFIFSLVAFVYFFLLIISSQFKYDPVFLGVVRELFTLPAIAAVLVLLVLSGMAFIKGNFKLHSFSFYSLLLLVLTIAGMIGFA